MGLEIIHKLITSFQKDPFKPQIDYKLGHFQALTFTNLNFFYLFKAQYQDAWALMHNKHHPS